MNELKNFNFEGEQVRTVLIDHEPYLVGNDIAQTLGYSDYRHAVMNHVSEGDKLRVQIDHAGQSREMTVINESGLYDLIFDASRQGHNQEIRMRAKRFRHWVTSEVLPSIRKHGAYMTDEKAYDVTHNPDGLADLLLQAGEQLKQKNLVIEEMKPKANYFDDLVERNLLTNFRDTAKELHIGQKKFIEWLLAHKYVYRDQGRRRQLKHYAKYDNELFEFRESVSEWSDKSYIQSLITPKGRATFKLLLKKDLTI